ncbi:Fluoride ion transporter CrcB like [Actinidia chinensis var. chinensis]|uniref:Fluoride ion transporter CrcB like n=1 Tax=Actinidia chinensis var. chinensis TaxID=1590841 RepID=A0A2R6QLR9_ACTCC|nr:Fluoride ion transporter CrcB like [Actinidia chinensis var. chinensis]
MKHQRERERERDYIYKTSPIFGFLKKQLIFQSSQIAKMAKNTGPVVCLLILVMDIVAGILAIEAEIAQNKVKHLTVWVLECRDPSYEAFKLGLAAAVLLALAHTIANLLGGCICAWSKEELGKASANKQLAVASLVFSWILLAVAFSMLIIGTLSNSSSRKSCGIADNRLLSLGGILCFIHGLFIVAYYVSATAVAREEKKTQHGDHA